MSKAYLERLGGHERDVDEAIIHEVANQAEQIVLARVLQLLLAQRPHHLHGIKNNTPSAKVNLCVYVCMIIISPYRLRHWLALCM